MYFITVGENNPIMQGGDAQEALKSARARQAGEEPIEKVDRVVRDDGSSHRSPVVNTSVTSRDELGFLPGVKVTVAIYSDRVVIRRDE